MNRGRNYLLLLASQFWSAFGDNFILVVILGPIMRQFQAHQITAQAQSLANIYYTCLLFVPYVLFAPLAGYLNDRFAKNRWLLGGNAIKLLGTGLVALGVSGRRSGRAWVISSSGSVPAFIRRPSTGFCRKSSPRNAWSKPMAPWNS